MRLMDKSGEGRMRGSEEKKRRVLGWEDERGLGRGEKMGREEERIRR